jgi:tetratricopeptide (TPR) repeat protein
MDLIVFHRAQFACILVLLGTTVDPALAGAGDDLRALVQEWRGAEAAAAETGLKGWSLPRARVAARGVGQDGRWPDPWVLGAALLCTDAAREEIRKGSGRGTGWFALAGGLLEKVADETLRRRWRRDWMLAIAAFHAGRYDGRAARDLLDQLAAEFPDDPDVLFAAGRLHEAIGARISAGRTEPLPPELADASERELLAAARLYEGAVEALPAHAVARLRRGRVLALLGRARSAHAELQGLLASSSEPELRCLAHLLLGGMAEKDGRLADALSAYRSAVGTGRSPEVAPLALAHLLARRGEGEAARRAVEGILATSEDAPSQGDAWWRYLLDGLGETSGEESRFESLRQEARR